MARQPVVLEATEGRGSLLGWDLGVDGNLSDILYAEYGSGMSMKGKEVFRNAVRVTVESARLSMERSGVAPSDIDLFVPHQANARIMESVAERLDLDPGRMASIIGATGNTSAASIPLTLIEAIGNGRVGSRRSHPVRRLRCRNDVGLCRVAVERERGPEGTADLHAGPIRAWPAGCRPPNPVTGHHRR